jgi:hypothetical protein
MAQQQVPLFNWIRGKEPIKNAVALAGSAVVLLIFSPVIIVSVLGCIFWLNEPISKQDGGTGLQRNFK